MQILCAWNSADVVTIEGADAGHFLQGQLSTDVTLLADGGNAWTFLLEPSGKCGAWGRICEAGPDRFAVVLPEGAGDAAAARLSRFLLRTDAAINVHRWPVINYRWEGELVGVSAAIVTELLSGNAGTARWIAVDVNKSVHSVGVDVVCVGSDPTAGDLPDLAGDALAELFQPSEVLSVSFAEIERIRIEAVLPAMNSEVVDGTIPAATGMVDDSVSFTKGCYTGQELVARMDARTAGSPEHLVLVRSVGESAPPKPGAVLTGPGASGRITSSAPSGSGWVALAYVPRSTISEASASIPVSVDGAAGVMVSPTA